MSFVIVLVDILLLFSYKLKTMEFNNEVHCHPFNTSQMILYYCRIL